jgi:hypothetical protein
MFPAAVKKMLPPALVWLLEMLMFPLEFSSMSVPALKVNADLAVAASSLIEEVANNFDEPFLVATEFVGTSSNLTSMSFALIIILSPELSKEFLINVEPSKDSILRPRPDDIFDLAISILPFSLATNNSPADFILLFELLTSPAALSNNAFPDLILLLLRVILLMAFKAVLFAEDNLALLKVMSLFEFKLRLLPEVMLPEELMFPAVIVRLSLA